MHNFLSNLKITYLGNFPNLKEGMDSLGVSGLTVTRFPGRIGLSDCCSFPVVFGPNNEHTVVRVIKWLSETTETIQIRKVT